VIQISVRWSRIGRERVFHYVLPDNGNVHRAAANITASKSRAARGSVCNVLLSRVPVDSQPQEASPLRAQGFVVTT